jgi:hypothetical protein
MTERLNPLDSIPQTASVSGITPNRVAHQSLPTEIIRDFLTVPGIAGIALIDGHPTPRLYSADPNLEIHQPKVFLANVTQILRTLTPQVQQLDCFFGTYRLYIRRMGLGFTVAVLTHRDVKWRNSSEDIKPFCQAVQSHLKASIPLLEDWASARNHHQLDSSSQKEPHWDTVSTEVLAPSPPSLPVATTSLPLLQDYLNAANHLSSIASQYLGSTIIGSQVKRSRPQGEILSMITVIAKGQLIISEVSEADRVLSPEELQALRQWTQDFRGQCSRIIRDFDTIAQTAGLTKEEMALLTGVL